MPQDALLHSRIDGNGPRLWHAILAGLCASLVGIGLARFGYTPLVPALIDAHWFAPADVMYLGAANLAGYLFGALLGRPLARRIGNRRSLRLSMVLTSLAFFGCAAPLSVAWFFAWRFVSGVSGGAIMVIVTATLLPHVPPARRGLASGAIFLGAGLGIACSGTLVPLLLGLGLTATWIGLGVFCALLTALAWGGWPAAGVAGHATPPSASARGQADRHGVRLLYAQYALMAAALVPTMIFLVDYVARGLGRGAHVGAGYWVLYGLGAIVGPVCYGSLADRLGSRASLRLVLGVNAAAVLVLAFLGQPLALALATLVIGSFPPGIAPAVLMRLQHLLPGDLPAQNRAWSQATVIFALLQALAGYGYSFVFERSGGDYRLLFVLGAAAAAGALALDVLAGRQRTT